MPLYYWICEKEIKCSASLAFYLFSPARLINSIKHEHSCTGFPHFFQFQIQGLFQDFSRLNRWFSRSHQCKIPGLFQVELMFFVARKPKLIRIMHLHIATTCKLLWSALYISACFFLFLNPLQSSPMSGTMDVNMYQRSLLFKQFGPRSGRIKCWASSGSKLFDTGCTCHKNVRHIIIL